MKPIIVFCIGATFILLTVVGCGNADASSRQLPEDAVPSQNDKPLTTHGFSHNRPLLH